MSKCKQILSMMNEEFDDDIEYGMNHLSELDTKISRNINSMGYNGDLDRGSMMLRTSYYDNEVEITFEEDEFRIMRIIQNGQDKARTQNVRLEYPTFRNIDDCADYVVGILSRKGSNYI